MSQIMTCLYATLMFVCIVTLISLPTASLLHQLRNKAGTRISLSFFFYLLVFSFPFLFIYDI